MELQFKPILDRVLILQEKGKEKTEGGIIIPENSIQGGNRGQVIAVGELVTTVKAGDHVIYDSPRCGKVELGGVFYDVARDITTPPFDGQIDLVESNENNK